ncbi:hypothetical protein PVK06_048655 [Gossypium arboreum]|uniref:Uncharacterized protein n=1 Tax=Gossypium arboreum TaxID=29729 RepID=A0ABR0MIH1_GOSAR|nr:hypothetical protein PVK06_048655 [Gossypium arboreum]
MDRYIDWEALQAVRLAVRVRVLIDTAPWDWLFTIVEPTYVELTLEFCLTFFLQTTISQWDKPRTISFRLGGMTHYLSISGFEVALGLYFEKFMDTPEFPTLYKHIHRSSELC